jgi:L-ornithine N5-monooxygenase
MYSVNCIFNPDWVDRLYPKPSAYRQSLIKEAKATNYGVVRLSLIETLFEMMYEQKRMIGHDETKWPHRIMGGRQLVAVDEQGDELRLSLRQASTPDDVALEADSPVEIQGSPLNSGEEILDVDLVIAATGYQRKAHVDMLKDAWKMLPSLQDGVASVEPRSDRWSVQTEDGERRVMEVSRDYKVKFADGTVAQDSGIWLQGCCEGTHGVSLPDPLTFCLKGQPTAHYTADANR